MIDGYIKVRGLLETKLSLGAFFWTLLLCSSMLYHFESDFSTISLEDATIYLIEVQSWIDLNEPCN